MLKRSKASIISESNSGLTGTEANLRHEVRQSHGHEKVPLSNIRPDPDNARGLSLTLEELRNPDSITDEAMREEADKIIGLSRTIASDGQLQPVIGYRSSGGTVRLIGGERRWWACQLAELEEMDVMVYADRPANAAVLQLLENAQRRDLTMAGTLRGLQQVMAECRENDKPINTGADLIELLGLERSNAFRWWAILNGPQDVLEAIKEGRISHPNVGRDVAKLADKPRATVLASDDIVAALRKHQASQERKGKTKKPSRGGRPATRAKLGTTKNMAVMEHMVKKI